MERVHRTQSRAGRETLDLEGKAKRSVLLLKNMLTCNSRTDAEWRGMFEEEQTLWVLGFVVDLLIFS